MARGLTQCARKLLPTIFRSKVPLRLKVEAFMHLTPNISYPLMVVVSALMLPVMIVRFYMGVWQMVFIDLPLIMAAFCRFRRSMWWRSASCIPRIGSGRFCCCRC